MLRKRNPAAPAAALLRSSNGAPEVASRRDFIKASGLAIGGFDPVAYFTESMAVQGLPDFEARGAGAIWRFRNEGNRASFVAHPEIYGPQFGGYDPVDLGRGVTYAGNPRFWVVVGQRLYLFGREDNRDAFAADPSRFLKEATTRWPALERGLAQ